MTEQEREILKSRQCSIGQDNGMVSVPRDWLDAVDKLAYSKCSITQDSGVEIVLRPMSAPGGQAKQWVKKNVYIVTEHVHKNSFTSMSESFDKSHEIKADTYEITNGCITFYNFSTYCTERPYTRYPILSFSQGNWQKVELKEEK